MSVLNFDLFTHAVIYTNAKAAFEKDGVAAAIMLFFATDPKSWITVWFAKREDGEMDFQTPGYPIQVAGETKTILCIQGPLAQELSEKAKWAQARLKAEVPKPGAGKIYKVTADKVELIKR